MTPDPSPSRRPSRGQVTKPLKWLGKYQIQRTLGVGGMGTVYLALDTELKRTVALKVLAKERAENPTLVRRFKTEGQAAALLKHPNIMNVFEAGQSDGHLFLALEYIDGVDVLEWMRKRGPISVKRSLQIVTQVAEALQHAYERKIVHRDIKPSNLIVSRDGVVKLADMGLARSLDDTLDSTITRDGTTVGTIDYMAPEQASDSRAADIRSDIYSLGCTWYHMLTGVPPYPEGNATNKLTAHLKAPIPNPRLINENIPEAIVAVLQRMMAKSQADRYQTPAELLQDLQSDVISRSGDSKDLLSMFAEEHETTFSASTETDSEIRQPPFTSFMQPTREIPVASNSSTEMRRRQDPRTPLRRLEMLRQDQSSELDQPRKLKAFWILLGLIQLIWLAVFLLVMVWRSRTSSQELPRGPETTLHSSAPVDSIEPNPQRGSTTSDDDQTSPQHRRPDF